MKFLHMLGHCELVLEFRSAKFATKLLSVSGMLPIHVLQQSIFVQVCLWAKITFKPMFLIKVEV